MTSLPLGENAARVEVVNVCSRGFTLLVADKHLFVPFDKFPWFRNATIAQISKVELLTSDHLYWADVDIDLAVDSIRHPENFPLVSRPSS